MLRALETVKQRDLASNDELAGLYTTVLQRLNMDNSPHGARKAMEIIRELEVWCTGCDTWPMFPCVMIHPPSC